MNIILSNFYETTIIKLTSEIGFVHYNYTQYYDYRLTMTVSDHPARVCVWVGNSEQLQPRRTAPPPLFQENNNYSAKDNNSGVVVEEVVVAMVAPPRRHSMIRRLSKKVQHSLQTVAQTGAAPPPQASPETIRVEFTDLTSEEVGGGAGSGSAPPPSASRTLSYADYVLFGRYTLDLHWSGVLSLSFLFVWVAISYHHYYYYY